MLICNDFVTMVKRIAISVDGDQSKLLDSVIGFGTKDAEKVKNILMAYLSEKGYVERFNNKRR